jgi:hypothetical protein
VGLLTAGLGSAGVVVGLALGARTLVLTQARQHYCDPGNVCDAEGVDLDQQARTAQTGTVIAIVAGGAVLAAGLALTLTAPSGGAVRVGAATDGHGGALDVVGRW